MIATEPMLDDALRIDDPRAAAPTPSVLNNRTHYAFYAGPAFSVADRHIGFSVVPRARLRLLHRVEYLTPDVSPEELVGEEPEVVNHFTGKVWAMKTPAEIADDLNGAYGVRGLKIIDALIGAPTVLAQYVQVVLMPKLPPTIIGVINALRNAAGIEHLVSETLSVETLEQSSYFLGLTVRNSREDAVRAISNLILKVRDEMLQSAQATLVWLRGQTSIVTTELNARKLPGGHGLSTISETVREYFRQVEQAIPDDLLEQIAKLQAEPQKVEIVMPNMPGQVDPRNQVQCLVCGAMANRIVATGLPPKRCSGCGEPFAQDADLVKQVPIEDPLPGTPVPAQAEPAVALQVGEDDLKGLPPDLILQARGQAKLPDEPEQLFVDEPKKQKKR